MLADPIFQGLAISMMAGEVAATLLSRIAVPVLYTVLARRFSFQVVSSPALPLAPAHPASKSVAAR